MKSSIARKALVILFCCFALSAQEQSLEYLQEAAAQQPSSAKAQNALGEALDEAGQLQAARNAFMRAVELNSAYGQAYSNLGLVCLQMSDVAEAAKNLDRAVALLGKTPDAGFTWYLRAKAYTIQNEHEKALKALNQAVALRPDLAEAWSDLGETQKLLSDDKSALVSYQRAVELKPNDAVAQYRLGAEYLHENKPHQAVEHLQRAYELNSRDQSTLNSLQTALRRDGKPEEADRIKKELAQLLIARDQESQNAVAAVRINNEGAELEKSGNLAEAAHKYEQALQLYPAHIGIRVNYAVALLRLGKWTPGLAQLREALRRDPNNPQIQAALKDALAQAPPSAQ